MVETRTAQRCPGGAQTPRGAENTYMGGALMGERTCTIDGCNKKAQARGWCPMHYQRWRHHGDPLIVMPHGMLGKKHTPEARAKIKAARAQQQNYHFVRTEIERANYSTWRSWASMLWRIDDPRNASYSRYGGRGITVCDRWRSFENFLADMGPRPEGKTLDRIDPDGNYEIGNCRWATKAEQERNKSNPWNDPIKRERILAGRRRMK